MMDRLVPWFVFGLVVALVVTVGSIGLAFLLPAGGTNGDGAAMERDQAGWPFSWGSDNAVDPREILAPLWLLLLVAVPLSLLGLAVTGLIWASRSGSPAAARWQTLCHGCGQGLEPSWRLCPYCGERKENTRDR